MNPDRAVHSHYQNRNNESGPSFNHLISFFVLQIIITVIKTVSSDKNNDSEYLNTTDNIVLRTSLNLFLFCNIVSSGEKDWQQYKIVPV